MATFTTRIELYGEPNYQVYENLHKKMDSGGFTRKITIDKKIVYWLPNAEYSIMGDQKIEEIRDLAVSITRTVWSDFGVLVTKSQEARSFYNLKKVNI